MGELKDYADAGDFEDPSFIDSLNVALGGSPDDMSNRTHFFFEALKSFGLIEVEVLDENAVNNTNITENEGPKNYCGVDVDDAGTKCSITCGDSFFDPACPEGENCYPQVVSCMSDSSNTTFIEDIISDNVTVSDNATLSDNVTLSTDDLSANATEDELDSDTQIEMAAYLNTDEPSITPVDTYQSTNYCGASWTSAATDCTLPCPSGMDAECPPNMFCFAEISCSYTSVTTNTNWCGRDWNDASVQCSQACPAGLDSGECKFLAVFHHVFACEARSCSNQVILLYLLIDIRMSSTY